MSHISEEEMRIWGNRKIPGYTGDPGQRGQKASQIQRDKAWRKRNDALNKAMNDLNKILDPPIPPGQQSGRPRPVPTPRRPVPMPTPTYKKSGPGYA
jgi:hypothetical protein